MVVCFVTNCMHTNAKGCSFFPFPQDYVICQKWIKLIRNENKHNQYSRVCSCHFKDGKMENLPKIFYLTHVPTKYDFDTMVECDNDNFDDEDKEVDAAPQIERDECVTPPPLSADTLQQIMDETRLRINQAGANIENNFFKSFEGADEDLQRTSKLFNQIMNQPITEVQEVLPTNRVSVISETKDKVYSLVPTSVSTTKKEPCSSSNIDQSTKNDGEKSVFMSSCVSLPIDNIPKSCNSPTSHNSNCCDSTSNNIVPKNCDSPSGNNIPKICDSPLSVDIPDNCDSLTTNIIPKCCNSQSTNSDSDTQKAYSVHVKSLANISQISNNNNNTINFNNKNNNNLSNKTMLNGEIIQNETTRPVKNISLLNHTKKLPTVVQRPFLLKVPAQKENELYLLRKELFELKTKVGKMCLEDIIKDDKKVAMYTGFQNAAILKKFFNHMMLGGSRCPLGVNMRKVNTEEQIFITLMRLRNNFPVLDLAYRWNCSENVISTVFTFWTEEMHRILFRGMMATVPSRSKYKDITPDLAIPSCRMIIGFADYICETGVGVEFNKKSTLRGVIGVAPNGIITFQSELYPSSVSDRDIVISSHLLDVFEHGDTIYTDKKLVIDDLLPPGVAINVLHRIYQMKEDDNDTVEDLRQVTWRPHLISLRATQKISFYKILDVIPSSLAYRASLLWQLCGALNNYQNPMFLQPGEKKLSTAITLSNSFKTNKDIAEGSTPISCENQGLQSTPANQMTISVEIDRSPLTEDITGISSVKPMMPVIVNIKQENEDMTLIYSESKDSLITNPKEIVISSSKVKKSLYLKGKKVTSTSKVKELPHSKSNKNANPAVKPPNPLIASIQQDGGDMALNFSEGKDILLTNSKEMPISLIEEGSLYPTEGDTNDEFPSVKSTIPSKMKRPPQSKGSKTSKSAVKTRVKGLSTAIPAVKLMNSLKPNNEKESAECKKSIPSSSAKLTVKRTPRPKVINPAIPPVKTTISSTVKVSPNPNSNKNAIPSKTTTISSKVKGSPNHKSSTNVIPSVKTTIFSKVKGTPNPKSSKKTTSPKIKGSLQSKNIKDTVLLAKKNSLKVEGLPCLEANKTANTPLKAKTYSKAFNKKVAEDDPKTNSEIKNLKPVEANEITTPFDMEGSPFVDDNTAILSVRGQLREFDIVMSAVAEELKSSLNSPIRIFNENEQMLSAEADKILFEFSS